MEVSRFQSYKLHKHSITWFSIVVILKRGLNDAAKSIRHRGGFVVITLC